MDRVEEKMEIEGEVPQEAKEAYPEATVPERDLEASAKLAPLDIGQLELSAGATTSTVSDSHITSSTTAYDTESQHKELTSQSEQTVVVTTRREVIDVTGAGEGQISLPSLGFGTGASSTVEQTSKTETTQHISHRKTVEVPGGAGDVDLSQFGVGPDGVAQQSSTVTVIKEQRTIGRDGEFTTEEHSEVLRVDEGTPLGDRDTLPQETEAKNIEATPAKQTGAVSLEAKPGGIGFSGEVPGPPSVDQEAGAASVEFSPPGAGVSVHAPAISLDTKEKKSKKKKVPTATLR